MNYSTRGQTLTVQVANDTGTVRVSRTNDDTTVAELTLPEAHELTPLLHRTLRLHGTNPEPESDGPHPFTVA